MSDLFVEGTAIGWFVYWAVSFARVFMRAMQQQNVVFSKWLMVIPFSYGMVYSEAFIVYEVSQHGVEQTAFALGTGAWMGCWAAMWLHRRLRDGH